MSRSKFSAGIVPVVFRKGVPCFLLLRAYSYWDFPKGGLDRDEEPLDAAIRELEEETSLREPKFRWGEEFIETDPYAGGKIARYYLAEVPDEPIELGINPFLGRAEHDEYRWVTYEEAVKLLVPRVKQVLDWARDRVA